MLTKNTITKANQTQPMQVQNHLTNTLLAVIALLLLILVVGSEAPANILFSLINGSTLTYIILEAIAAGAIVLYGGYFVYKRNTAVR